MDEQKQKAASEGIVGQSASTAGLGGILRRSHDAQSGVRQIRPVHGRNGPARYVPISECGRARFSPRNQQRP